jgi:hypothetical protein
VRNGMADRNSTVGRAALGRAFLGFAQMLAAAVAMGLLVNEGVKNRAVVAVILACAPTALSILLRRGWRTR